MPINFITTAEPKIKYGTPGQQLSGSLSIPAGVLQHARRPARVEYRRRMYIAGQFSKILTLLPDFGPQLVTAGIQQPGAAVMTSAAGGSLTGNHIGYYSGIHKSGSTVIHEGNISPGSSTVVMNGGSASRRAWTFPATAPDARTTHWRPYASVDGALPRVVTGNDVPIGTTTLTEGVATAALGDTPPINSLGQLTNGRGVPPYCRFVAKFHDRAWYAGDPNFPYRVWYSELNEFESVGANSYIDTRDGETVTGLIKVNDQLLIACMQCFYDIRGYRVNDFVIRKINPDIGCISHFAMVIITDGAGEKLIFPEQSGLYYYDGSFHYVSEDKRDFWKADYEANRAAYENSIAIDNREHNVYKLLIQKPSNPTTKSYYYIFYYLNWHASLVGGGPQMDSTTDLRGREDKTLGYLSDGSGRRIQYTGNCDGYLRKEDVASDSGDDNDSYSKKFVLRSFHDMRADPGGDSADGKVWKKVWLFVKSELVAWSAKFFAGDMDAGDNTTAAYDGGTIAASAGTDAGARVLEPKTVHDFEPDATGRGLTHEISATAPRGIAYRGWGGTVTPGQAESRGVV